MQRYFAENNDINNIILNKDDIFHITKVMRNNVDDEFQIVCNSEVFQAKILNINLFKFEVISKIEDNRENDGYIRLLYCIPKGEKLDLVIQKAVELGCSEIVLVNSSRCVRKLENTKDSNKLVRFHKIIKEASEQCKRNKMMKLSDIISYKDIKKYTGDLSYIAYENSESSLLDLYQEIKNAPGKTINILIGAEGGFSLEEVEYANSCGYKTITLGKRILRSETSCLYVLSLLTFFMEAKL